MDPCFVDVETRGTIDLRKVGAHRYASHPATDVIVLAYAFGVKGDRRRWWPGMPVPLDLASHILVGGDIVAHNAEFERCIFKHILGPRYSFPVPKTIQYHCTAAMANAMSLPRPLEQVGAVLGLGVQKDKEGHRLMLQMCKPRNGPENDCPSCGGEGHDLGRPCACITWWDDPDKLTRLAEYCDQDVEVTQSIFPVLRPLSEFERRIWLLDAEANDFGVKVDLKTVKAARKVVAKTEKRLGAELKTLTQGTVSSANQIDKLLRWLQNESLDITSLAKDEVDRVVTLIDAAPSLAAPGCAGDPAKLDRVKRVLKIRAELAKASTAKLDSMLRRADPEDHRARGNLIYHGASTGRWAGVGIQLQNLPRGDIKGAERCLDAILTGDDEIVRALWGSSMSAVSSSLRSMFMADEGCKLIAADLSNIEGRTLAALAGEEWKLQAFRDYDAGLGHDLYNLAYARSFGVDPNLVDKDQRQIGKVQELALGFGGGKGAFQAMAAIYGVYVSEDRAEEIKLAWRAANPKIVEFWYALEEAAKAAITNPGSIFYAGDIGYQVHAGFLWCRLPSGRLLAYAKPSLEPKKTPWGEMRLAIHFWGVNSYTRKWEKLDTYGGKLAENVTQATARDVMAGHMLDLASAGYRIILTVHDEIIAEAALDRLDLNIKDMSARMSRSPVWLPQLPVSADGWEGERYRKG